MKESKLQVWDISTRKLQYRVINHNITIDQTGLKMVLIDEIGAKVEIIYDQSSQVIGVNLIPLLFLRLKSYSANPLEKMNNNPYKWSAVKIDRAERDKKTKFPLFNNV